MPEHSHQESLRLIDSNIRLQSMFRSRPLKPWWCEKCGRKLMYPNNAPKPQCPYCYSSQGLLVPMRTYFIMPGGNNDHRSV